MDQPFNPDPQQDNGDAEILAAIGVAISEKRDEAVKARAASGIEKVWLDAEEAYLGIDDANRGDWNGAKWAKPMSMEGPLTREKEPRDVTKSTLYIPLTARYVDAGHAKVSEILLPIDDKPFSFDPTPVPELVSAREQLKQIMANGGEMPQPQPPAQMPQQPMAAAIGAMGGMPPGGPQQPQAPQQPDAVTLAKQAIDKASKAAEAAEKRIYDWLVEAKFPAEMRKMLFDSARIGVGVIKAPFADVRKSMALSKEGETLALEIVEKVVPSVAWKDPWNCFPDPAAGEDIHAGEYFFERDYLTKRKLIELKKLPEYLPDQIDKVLKEGPQKCYLDEQGQVNPSAPSDPKLREKQYQVWYFYGSLTRREVQAAQAPGLTDSEKAKDDEPIYVVATVINDTVVRVVLNPLDSGRFPYRVFPWRRRPGHWAGMGISEQCAPAQKMCNAATRAMLTSAGNSAGIQLMIDQQLIFPANNEWKITPNKIWYKMPGAVIDDIRKAFSVVEFPDRQQTMMSIIEYAFRIAEESTNIPLITQGQSGVTTPDTYGAAQLQNNNANQLLRDIAATCDDNITEPMIRDFYEWLLLDPDVPQEEKGDFQISAHGSTALVERAIQDQTIQNLVEPSLNPAYELSPSRTMIEYLKSKRLDPRFVTLTDEEKQQMKQTQPPPAPQVQAAQIRSEADIQKTQLQLQTEEKLAAAEQRLDALRIKSDIDRDTVYVNAETQRTMSEREARMEELRVKLQLAQLDYAAKHQISIEQVKAQLAQTAMKLQTQKELSLASHTADLHKHHNPAPQVMKPPTEPAGRAPNGQAFQA